MAVKMNSPYMGKFRITQAFKGASHDGLDLVGIDSKEATEIQLSVTEQKQVMLQLMIHLNKKQLLSQHRMIN